MRFTDLKEAEVANFADQADRALSDVAGKAKAAYGRLKDAYKSARGEVRGEINRVVMQGQREHDQAADAKAKADKAALKSASEAGAPAIIANLALATHEPGVEDMAAIDDFDAEAYQRFQASLEAVEGRVLGLSKLLKTTLKHADFLSGSDRTDARITDLLADVDDARLDPIERALVRNNDDLAMWRFILATDDQAAVAKRVLSQLTRTSAANERKNLAGTAAGKAKSFYTGSGLVRVLRGQAQVVERRLAVLKELVRDHESRPVTEALQRRVGRLVKTLRA